MLTVERMNIFDEYLIGNIDVIKWNFNNTHFNKRLSDNGISRGFIEDIIKNEDFIRWESEKDDTYSVFFKAPDTKHYKEIKVIMACRDDIIDLVSIMPISNKFNSKEYNALEKKRLQAIAKRNRKK